MAPVSTPSTPAAPSQPGSPRDPVPRLRGDPNRRRRRRGGGPDPRPRRPRPPVRSSSAVDWSAVNYKDGMVTRPGNRVARISPLVPGVDLVGTVAASTDPPRCRQPGHRPRLRPRGGPSRRLLRVGPGAGRVGGPPARRSRRPPGGHHRHRRLHRRPLPPPARAPRPPARGRSGAGDRGLRAAWAAWLWPCWPPGATRWWPARARPPSGPTCRSGCLGGDRPGRARPAGRSAPWAPSGGPAAVDCVGGPTLAAVLRSLRYGARRSRQRTDRREHPRDHRLPLHRARRHPDRRGHRPHPHRRAAPGVDRDGHGIPPDLLDEMVAGGRAWTSSARSSIGTRPAEARGRILVRPGPAGSLEPGRPGRAVSRRAAPSSGCWPRSRGTPARRPTFRRRRGPVRPPGPDGRRRWAA